MSETAAITAPEAGQELWPAPRVTRFPLYGVGVVAAICLLALLWLFYDGSQVLRGTLATLAPGTKQLELQRQFQDMVQRSSLIIGLGAAAVLLALVGWGSVWKRTWVQQVRTREEQWRRKEAGWQMQAGERERTEAMWQEVERRLQTQLGEVSKRNTALEAELNQRKRNEQTLTFQRQELTSTKTVLELNVQARAQELQTLKHRYELILNSAGEGICGLDLDGRITFVNPAVARFTGWSLEEIVGKTEQEIFRPEQVGGAAGPVDGTLAEQIFCRKDGSRSTVECVRTRIEEGGRQTGSVMLFKDITERRRAEESLAQKAAELSRSNAELEQFAFVASHDLQEPLRKIQAFGDRLKTKGQGLLPADAMDYLDRMQSASARMRTLIDDLLAFSRVIRSAEPFIEVDLGKVTQEVLGDLEVRLEKSGGRVEVGELPKVEADPTQMRQLIQNLVGNALKFQPPNSKPIVKIHGRRFTSLSSEEYCELTVQDNGIGFDDQYAEKIFAVFQRLHGRGEYEGTGVGLAVCRRITDRHQGTILAAGKPGEGATFTITLPVKQPKPKITT